MMKRLVLPALFAAFFSVPAAAQERVEAFEFGLAINDYDGQTVTVEGCQFAEARLESVYCRIVVGTRSVGGFSIDTEGVERDVLRQVILDCPGAQPPGCLGEVTGTLEINYGVSIMRASALRLTP